MTMRDVDGDSRMVPFDAEDFRLLLSIGADCVCGRALKPFNDLAVRTLPIPHEFGRGQRPRQVRHGLGAARLSSGGYPAEISNLTNLTGVGMGTTHSAGPSF